MVGYARLAGLTGQIDPLMTARSSWSRWSSLSAIFAFECRNASLLRELLLAPPFGDSPLMLLLNTLVIPENGILPLLGIFPRVMLVDIGALCVIVPSDIGLLDCLGPGDIRALLRLALFRIASCLILPNPFRLRSILAAALFLLLLIASCLLISPSLLVLALLLLAPLFIPPCLILTLHLPAPVIDTLLLAPLFVSPALRIIVIAHQILHWFE
jgi:hypothetical protein